jgi:uncharacterized protein YfaS (alpha-2-macroglobulin family)
MISRVLAAVSIILLCSFAWAEDSPVPDRRLMTEVGQDYYGGDIGSLFDRTFKACVAACTVEAGCSAFTYNSKASACFLKNTVGEKSPFDGAISGRFLPVSDEIQQMGRERGQDLDFIPDGSLQRARDLARRLGERFAANARSVDDLLTAARSAESAGDLPLAAQFYGAAITLSGNPDIWRDLARVWMTQPVENGTEQRRLRSDAVLAAINAYLRSRDTQSRATSLNLLARTLEASGYGKETIPAFRLSQSLAPRDDTDRALGRALERYGFRFADHSVDSDAASPRICVQFTEPLAEAGVDYAPYVKIEGHDNLAVVAEPSQLCIEGVVHGERYRITVRGGLPSATGESLRTAQELTVYVRDRAPSVRFVGRNYVLPRGNQAAIPVVTVNLTEVELRVHRIGDRNLLPAIHDNLFDQAINTFTEKSFAKRRGEAIWNGVGEVSGPVNADVITALPIGDAVKNFEPGVYVMTARVPGSDSEWDRAPTQWFVVTDLGLATMSGADGLHGFVRALSSAEPLDGVEVTLLARNNEVLGRVTTDARGYVAFAPGLTRGTGGAAPALLTAERDGDFAFLDLTKAGFDLSDRGVEGRNAPGPIDVFATTERGVYRPGEVVHATVLARDGKANAISDLPLTAIFTRPDGVEYHRKVLSDQGAGGRAHSMRLGAGVPRGTWRMKIHADPEAAPLRQVAFLVEDFVPERIAFDLDAPEGLVRRDSPPTVSLTARYLYGAPGAGLPVEGSVRISQASGLPGFTGFSFGLHDEALSADLVTLPVVKTDANGAANLTLRLPDTEPVTKPLQMTAIVHVTDSSGRPVERTLTRPLAPGGVRIGVKPLFEGAAEEGSLARFEVLAAGPDGQQTEIQRTGWTLSRINRSWQWYELNGRWNYEPITRRERIASGELALTLDGRAVIENPVEWGQYELKIVSLDGSPTATSISFVAGWYAASGSTDTPDVLELGLDKDAYRIGETVRVRLKPRAAGKVLLSVVDNRLIEMKALDVEAGETEVSLLVTEEWGPGAYITASLIRPMEIAAKRNPSRALGVVWANVDPEERALGLEITTPNEVQPRGPMDVAVRIANLDGEQAHVTLAAVDLGILNLTGFEPPAPSDHYFGQRALGMEMQDLYGRLIDGMQGVRGRIRSGGDAEAARLKAPPPTEALVAFFSGVLPVQSDGTASAVFELPEFNGTVRIMAVAWTADGVGHAHKDVLVRDPIVVSAASPRFLAPDDTTRILLDVAHATGPSGNVSVSVRGDGGIALGERAKAHTLDLAAGQTQQIDVPVTAIEIGDPELSILTTTPDGTKLIKSLTVPVRLNDAEIARQSRIPLAAGGRLVVNRDTFAGLRLGTARASLGIGPIASLDAPGLLSALDRYPYGCTEQVTSGAMPLLYFNQVADAMGLSRRKDVSTRISDAIGKVLENQSNAGSFGLWRPDRGDLWLDSYVTDFLSRARAAGHAVPKQAMQSALDNLRSSVGYAGDFENAGEDIAYALMVLAREGMASIGDLRYYADAKADDLATPMAKAQLGAALASYGEQRRADQMFRLASQQVFAQEQEERGWRVDYGSHLRDAAAVLTLSSRAGSRAVDADRLAALLAEREQANRWTSTQEKVWMLLATSALADQGSDGITVDGQPADGPVIRMFEDAALGEGEVVIENRSDRPTQAVLTTYGVPIEAEPAGGRGYQIAREYYTLDGQQVSPASVLQNTRLVVVLTVTSESDRQGRLMVNDPLPAGLEIDNPNLIQAGSIDTLTWLDGLDEVANVEFRTDRFLAAVDRSGAGSFRLAYIVRAVSPGSFHHPAATVEDMYRPEMRAWTDAGRVSVIGEAR